MTTKRFRIALTAAVLAPLAMSAASAQTSAPPTKLGPSKSKPAQAASGIGVTVSNQRTVGLIELDIARAGSPSFKALVRTLGPGQKTVVKLPNSEDCVYDIHVKYVDGALNDITGLDLCRDGKINLVD